MGIQPDISQRRTHQTLGVQRLAVHSEDYWDYKPGQAVQTTDGLPGTVTAVLDGPYPGTEEYQVELDQGMGGGAYTASQLRPGGATTAAMEQTAAADYPELSSILIERPDPAGVQVYAAKANPFAKSDDDDDSEDDDQDDDSDDSDDDKGDEDNDDSDDDSDDDGDDNTPPWVKKDASALFASLIVTAAADIDFRFQVTSAWKDIVAKAKRIRSEGGVRVTLASDGLVFAEVKGDTEVYEAGLQRLPNKQAIHSWSCGCKWGAYHWGADDDFSKFAGRMCSHALALQYEAQSRGMFGRNVGVDETRPHWVPRKVVVRYDIDSDQHRLAPSTAALAGQQEYAGPALSLVARAAVAAGEDRAEVLLALTVVGVKAGPGQGELFSAAPYKVDKPKAPAKAAAPAEESLEHEGRDEDGYHYKDDEYGDRSYTCRNPHCDEGEHEDRQTVDDHDHVYTNWDQVHPHLGPEIHRGMAVSLPSHVHHVVHDEHRPTSERAKALSDHIGAQGLGSHWTPDSNQGGHYAGASDSNEKDTHVVLHAHTPAKEHIETDPEELRKQDVIAMGDHDDAEVPLSFGSPVSLKGVSWRHRAGGDWTRHDFHEPVQHQASVSSPFGEPSGTSYQLPKAPGATAPKMPWENPASAGPLAGADPVGWNRKLPLESYASLDDQHSLFEPGGSEAQLNEEPEGALPATDGVQLPSNDEALSPSTAGLRRQALKDFSLVEREALMNEGEGVRAANLDLLKIEGTHYADLEQLLAAQEDDTTWLE